MAIAILNVKVKVVVKVKGHGYFESSFKQEIFSKLLNHSPQLKISNGPNLTNGAFDNYQHKAILSCQLPITAGWTSIKQRKIKCVSFLRVIFIIIILIITIIYYLLECSLFHIQHLYHPLLSPVIYTLDAYFIQPQHCKGWGITEFTSTWRDG